MTRWQEQNIILIKPLKFQYDDGGRKLAGYKGDTGDCVTRAIAIITDLGYRNVYDELNILGKAERLTARHKTRSTSRLGVQKKTWKAYLASLGYERINLMTIGSGCQYHLRKGELPATGRYIVQCSRHLTALINGIIFDTQDPSRGGMRCVYGYYQLAEQVGV